MFSVDVSRVVDCPVEVAFDFMTDFENDPQWWTDCVEARRTSEQERGVGTTFYEVNKTLHVRDAIEMEVTAYERPHRMVTKTISGHTPFVATYLVREVAGGTEVRMVAEVDGTGIFRIFGPLFKPLLARVTERHFDTLKRVLDAKGSARAA
jgi:uncharacterized protein YndB with AHSA1/START domain